MDVDQSFLPVPAPVKAAIFESFARQNMIESEADVKLGIQMFIKRKYGFPSDSSTEFIYGDSPLALFNNTGFKLTADALIELLQEVDKPWAYLSGPTINPTGLLYSNEEIQKILSRSAKFGARVMIDTSFSGLEFNIEGWGGWNLEEKEAFRSFPGLSIPHSTVKYAIKKLLDMNDQKAGDLFEALLEQKKRLRSKSLRLKEILLKYGWDVVECCGSVSMVAKPFFHLGTTSNLKLHLKVTDSNMREAIL
ncbi:hypothetical protein GIB67_025522 [Kingdonia uniflora]|uniref:Aminotransferase class I/classII large domain-containing protein n=1 Tax=Kingdonia uniflora TaxID=39325 RepID=A0A7J7M0A7_9MAGN|nr:hypothetical protein GIB67_025522 [Kingdonia uniflora]